METIFPLHPAQNDVFRAQLIDTDSPFYNVGGYVKLKGALDKEKFIEAVSAAPRTFDAFRMRFHVTETDAVCFFDDGFDAMEITELDFSGSADPTVEAVSWMRRRFNIAFPIQKERLLFENVLIKIAVDEHWFFMRYHHLVMDGYCFRIWLQFLAKKYTAFFAGLDTQPDYPHYANEICKANEYLHSTLYQTDSLYWKERIKVKPKKILQSRYSNSQHLSTATYNCQLSDKQKELLENLQTKSHSGILQLTIAALLLYFGKTAGEFDMVIGIPLHKRESREMRNTLGMFSGILPFKAAYQPKTKLVDFLSEVKQLQKKDYRHKNYLLGDISRDLHLTPGHEGLCEIVVNYETLHLELDFGEEVKATAAQLTSEYDRIPLQFCWQEFGNQQPLQLQVIFRKDYFSQNEIALLSQRILFILEQFPLKFEEAVESIDIIPTGEAQALQAFNRTEPNCQTDDSPISLFEQQVKRTPNRTAVQFADVRLTYQQLNERANQLAHYLKKKGVQHHTLVPICMERSFDMIIGILAILKSGGTYVPIDPFYPLERIQHILDDIKAKVIVTSKLSRTRLPATDQLNLVRIDEDWLVIAAEERHNLQLPISPSTLVYVIYTSGSTGKPKGVQMPGSNLVNLLQWQEKQFQHTCRHVLQFASLNFDVSFQEIFSTLCFGSTLYLIKESQRSDMPELAGAINGYGITHLFIPCIVLKCLAEYVAGNAIDLPKLKTIIVAGEQLLLTNDTRRLLDVGGITLINQYGPTEAHVVTSFTVDRHYNGPSALPPIGKPIDGTGIYIVDNELRMLPLGVAGEICITGAGVAKGYLHNEQLTAEKFIANPFGEGKMYRTGDIGRWLPGGNLEFLGRADNQVKIRGFRVEIGEIENVLQQCDFVRQCMVVAKENKEGTKQLVGYIIPEKNFSRNAVVAFLESKLPGYMIPSLFIPLTAFPITPNGKVDRSALPPSDEATGEYAAPKTVIETTLVKIWQEVLGLEKVSIHDDFFELGGHSLLVVKTIAKINQQTGRNLPTGSLFQYPTVEKYANFLLEGRSEENTKHIIPIKTGNGKMPLYIIAPIAVEPLGRFIPFTRLLNENQPVYGIELPEVSQLNINTISIESIAARYVVDLQTHNPQGPYALSGYSIGGLIAFEMAKQLDKAGKKVALLCLFDTVAYTQRPEPSEKANAHHKNKFQLYPKLKAAISSLYHRIDDNIYAFKYNPLNTILGKKDSVISVIKKMLKVDKRKEQKTDEQRVHDDLLKLSFAAYKEYQLTPYTGDITLFRAKRRIAYLETSKTLGWSPYARAVNVIGIEGNHYSIFAPIHCKHLAKKVQQCLDRCNNENSYLISPLPQKHDRKGRKSGSVSKLGT